MWNITQQYRKVACGIALPSVATYSTLAFPRTSLLSSSFSPSPSLLRASSAAWAAAALLCPVHHASARNPILSSVTVRHGSGYSQSHRANRASHRASGSPYRVPKGRPAPTNPWHIKEPLPQVTQFAPVRHEREIRRRQAAKNRQDKSTDDVIDWEVDTLSGEIVPLKGKDGKRLKKARTKTPLHKQVLLKKTQERVMAWNAEQQAAAEADADRFLAEEFEAIERERAALEEQIRELPEQEQVEMRRMFEEEVLQAQQEAQSLVEQEQQQQEDAAEQSRAGTKRSRKPRVQVPTFGIQTVLKFLKEYDVAVKVPPKKGKKKSAENENVKFEDNVDKNPLNQDLLVYDVISRFNFSDYIVVVKANSARQMRHLAESSYKMARALNACSANPRTLSLEGRGREDWMLVDAGHIWMYFFNRTPVVALPNAGGIFGVNFQIPQPNVTVTSMKFEAASSQSQQQQLPSHLSALQSSVEFTSASNPFDPTSSRRVSAGQNAAATIDPDTVVRETSSQINSTMWYEATPDNPTARKKSQINTAEQQAQMASGDIDSSFQQRVGDRKFVVDAEFTAVSGGANSKSFNSSSTNSAVADPSLALLHASNFVHPVLENLEKTYGDLRVAVDKVSALRDYPHEDLRNDIRHVGEAGEQAGVTSKKKKQIGRGRTGGESIEIEDTTTTVVAKGQ